MKKRFIPTLVALIVLIILVIYANEYETEEILQPGEVKPVPILGCSENDIKSISFGNNKNYNLKVVFEKQTSKIVQPAEYSGDYAETFGIARHFAELESEHYFAGNATDSTVYGFHENSPMVKLETASKTYELTLGNKVAIGNSFYLRIEGDPLTYIVPSHVKGSFYKALEDLRDRALYNEDFDRVNDIVYECGSTTFRLTLDSKYSEWLIADTKYSADNVEVANLINNMRNLRISNFLDSNNVDAEEFELVKPSLHIVMTNEKGKVYELKAGAMQGVETFVTSDGKVVQRANTNKLNELKVELNDIREKFLDITPITDLTEIEVKDATGTINIQKVSNAWLNGDIKVKDADVKDFINVLARARIEDYGTKDLIGEAGLSDETKCSYIALKSKDKTQKIIIGETKGIITYLMADDELILINSQVDSAFKKFLYQLRTTEKIIKNN